MGTANKENGMYKVPKMNLKYGMNSIKSGIDHFSSSNMDTKATSSSENNGGQLAYSNVYTTKARVFNGKLDLIANELENYARNLNDLLRLVKENFSEEQNFSIGISNVIQEIDREINNFNTSIDGMKSASLAKAQSKDQQITLMKKPGFVKKRENNLIN